MRVHELVAGRSHRREDSEPAEGIVARALMKDAGRNARPAHSVIAVTAGDDVALELVLGAFAAEANVGPVRLDVVDGDVRHLEEQREIRVEPRGDQILHDLGLAVDRDRAPACELAQWDAMPLAVELKLDAVVDDSLVQHAVPHSRLDEEIGRALLEHAGADPVLDVVAATVLEHDRLDALALEQAGQSQPGRSGADDRHLRSHQPLGSCSSSTRCATANAPFAAGTPQ